MGAYGNPDAAIAGMIVGVPNAVESAIACLFILSPI